MASHICLMKGPECIHHNYFDLFFEVVYVELSVNYLGLFTEVQTDLHFYKRNHSNCWTFDISFF